MAEGVPHVANGAQNEEQLFSERQVVRVLKPRRGCLREQGDGVGSVGGAAGQKPVCTGFWRKHRRGPCK